MQRVRSTLGKKPLTQFVPATLCVAGTQVSHAQTSGDLGSVQSTAVSSSDNSTAASKNTQSAPAQASSQGSLTASEPKSVISQPIGGFAVTNFSAAYTFKNLAPWLRNTRLGFQIDNLFNRTSIDELAGYTAADSTPLYWTIPGRAFIGTLSTDF